MKEIKNKILESIANEEFNTELIGDKIKLQNKINQLQNLIDVINVLQPIKEDEFILPSKYCFLCKTEKEFKDALTYFCEKYNGNINIYKPRETCYFAEKGEDFGFHRNIELYKNYTEITFEQFKKYVLNDSIRR